MQLRLHNTLTRTKEVFTPVDPKRVRLYVCGPTVYQRIHVGNARPMVVYDVLFRLLRHLYGDEHVVYVRNITDIDDKIIDQARKNGESIRELTDRTTTEYQADAAALGCLPPTHEPRATEHIDGMIGLIAGLIERGHAYAAEGHVLFSVPSMPAYGRLSGRNRDEQIAGARVDVAPYKRDPADFVLWKPSTADQPGWDSPWGHGRPGWHIECSAMSEAFLGPLPFDIHGGGLDLIFPHHENEIAQSCCAHGIDTMARFWLHNGFLDMRGEKMSKSLGNVVSVADALAVAPGEAVRMQLLSAHYRQPADFDLEVVFDAKRVLDRLYGALARLPPIENGKPHPEAVNALSDDLNTPKVLAIMHEMLGGLNRAQDVKAAADLKATAGLIGLLQDCPEHWLKGDVVTPTTASMILSAPDPTISGVLANEDIDSLVAARRRKRIERDFAEADLIRSNLLRNGVILEDRPDGSTDWRRA